MQIIMVNKSVLVKQEAEDTGIISNTIAVGSVVKSEEGSLVTVGTKMFFKTDISNTITYNGKEYRLIKESDIFGAIIND